MNPTDESLNECRRGSSPQGVNKWIKIVLIGVGGVGKTCIVKRFVTGQFDDAEMTRGMDAQTWSVEDAADGRKYNLLIFDLGGQPQFRFFTERLIEGAKVCLAVFSVDRYESLLELDEWMPNIKSIPRDRVILVGNKMDLGLSFSEKEIEFYSEKWNAPFVLVSAKTGMNFDKLRQIIIDTLKGVEPSVAHCLPG